MKLSLRFLLFYVFSVLWAPVVDAIHSGGCYRKRRLIFMPVPVVQKELIWDATCESLSLLAPIPWVYPLGAVPRWAGVGGDNTSRSCRRAAMVGHDLPPFRSVKNTIQKRFQTVLK